MAMSLARSDDDLYQLIRILGECSEEQMATMRACDEYISHLSEPRREMFFEALQEERYADASKMVSQPIEEMKSLGSLLTQLGDALRDVQKPDKVFELLGLDVKEIDRITDFINRVVALPMRENRLALDYLRKGKLAELEKMLGLDAGEMLTVLLGDEMVEAIIEEIGQIAVNERDLDAGASPPPRQTI